MATVHAIGIGMEFFRRAACHDRGVVSISHNRALRTGLFRFAHHPEERSWLGFSIDHPIGIEDFVAAVLGVCLRKHHQFHVARVALECVGKVVEKVVNLVWRQSQSHRGIGCKQGSLATPEQVHMVDAARLDVMKERLRCIERIEHHLGHAIVNRRLDDRVLCSADLAKAFGRSIRDATLNPPHRAQATRVRNVSRFGSPRRNCAQSRYHQKEFALALFFHRWTVGQQLLQYLTLRRSEGARGFDKMPKRRLDAHAIHLQRGQQFFQAKCRKRG